MNKGNWLEWKLTIDLWSVTIRWEWVMNSLDRIFIAWNLEFSMVENPRTRGYTIPAWFTTKCINTKRSQVPFDLCQYFVHSYRKRSNQCGRLRGKKRKKMRNENPVSQTDSQRKRIIFQLRSYCHSPHDELDPKKGIEKNQRKQIRYWFAATNAIYLFGTLDMLPKLIL